MAYAYVAGIDPASRLCYNGRMADILVLGDINVDVIAHYSEFPGEGRDAIAQSIEFHCGGSAANTALSLAQMHLPVRLIGRVGSDPWGAVALRRLHEAGVSLDAVVQEPAAGTGLIYIVVTPGGERTMLSYRGVNAHTEPAQVRRQDMVAARHLHLSGYALLLEPQRSAACRALDLARSHGRTVSLDPGLAPASLDETRALLPRIDVLLPTLAEAQALSRQGEPEACLAALLAQGVGTVAIKLGREGCLVGDRKETFRVPACPVDARDSTGAGDCFDAGLVAAWLAGLGLRPAALLANAFGAARVAWGAEGVTPRAVRSLLRDPRTQGTLAGHIPAVGQAADWLDTLIEKESHA